MIYSCCNHNRKAAVLNNPGLNGIDYLEVLDSAAVPLGLPRQQTLVVHCLNPLPTTPGLTVSNVMIAGGESITGVAARWVARAATPPPSLPAAAQSYFTRLPDAPNVIVVGTNEAGDFSTYTFRLVDNADQALADPFSVTEAMAGFDPQLAEVHFSFKIECGPSFDCQPQPPACAPAAVTPPPINYLAKDYGSFRQVMLDRLSQLLPNWNPTSEADFGVTLVELIAYVADNLSYQQDAIATEAYLETARSRISLRRHALLVNYHVHDGCNARAWIQIQVAGNTGDQIYLNHTLTRFYTYAPGMPPNLAVGSNNEEAALLAGVTVFEPMQDAVLYPEHNQISFYTWGDTNCCLPQGATEATLSGSYPNLQPGAVLIFQEMIGPQTGQPADADIRHRCAVRLTQVATQNPNGTALVDPLFIVPQNGGPPFIGLAAPAAPTVAASTSAGSLTANTYYTRITYVLTPQGETAASAETSTALSGTGELTVTGPAASGGAEFYNVYMATASGAEKLQNPSPISIGTNYTQSASLSTTTTPLGPAAVTEIQWSQEDALPFPVCLCSQQSNGALIPVSNVSVVFGNVVLADHGLSFAGISLPPVPPPRLFYTAGASAQRCEPGNPAPVPVRYRPSVPDIVPGTSLTQAVPLPLAGVPITPGILMLTGTGSVNLTDSDGFVCLTVRALDAFGWPQFFAVQTTANAANPSNTEIFDLAVLYDPAAGAPGIQLPVILERFTNLSLKPSDPNYVGRQINMLSQFISVPSTYTPPATAPSGFPNRPTRLANTGAVVLTDTNKAAYLTLQATNSAGWPINFGVVSQDTGATGDNAGPPVQGAGLWAAGTHYALGAEVIDSHGGSEIAVAAGVSGAAAPVWPTTVGAKTPDGASLVWRLQQEPPAFNLLVVYNPPSGGVNVNLPVTIEQFNDVSLATVGSQFASTGNLVTAMSFAQAPNPGLSAAALMNYDPSDAVPVIALTEVENNTITAQTPIWVPEPDLLGNNAADQVFVVEVESNGTATLRFGDNVNGKTPAPGTSFLANFRVGNGTAGNVGADSLVYLAAADARIQSCRNPLPATGGADQETNDQVRRRAPQAFFTQERAITMADYQNIAETNPQVDSAVASLRWTGSWYTVFVAVEPHGGGNMNPVLQRALMANEERYRLAGQDLLLDSPQYVSLEIVLQVTVAPNYFQADVKQSLLQVLGNGILPNGTKGLFYPDNFTFGQTVYLSPVYTAARKVAGVLSVVATTFQPQGVNTTRYLAAGEIKLASLQVARLDNDPDFPDHGQLTLVMQGGK